MAQQFANYQDMGMVDQPSIFHELFGSPLRVQKTFQKASLFKHMLSGGMWSKAIEGKGITWGGIVGFRGIALGESRKMARFLSPLSPAQAVEAVLKGIKGESTASNFAKFGLFGHSGLLNKSNNKFANTIGRIFGGGVIESSKFAVADKDIETALSGIHRLQSQMWMSKADKGLVTELKKTLGRNSMVQKLAKESGITGKASLRAGKFVEKNLSKRVLITRLAKIGKLASWLTAADMAFDIGSFVAGAAVNIAGNAVDKIERSMSSLIQRKHEFAGKVGVGFYTARSGTERQRALSALGNGYGGESGMGNEAGYQHVDSTW